MENIDFRAKPSRDAHSGDAMAPTQSLASVPSLELFARTEVGCIRERNEDVFVVANFASGDRGLRPGSRRQAISEHGTLVGVCDGMGGAAGGQCAAQLAGESLYDSLLAAAPFGGSEAIVSGILAAFGHANASIRARAEREPALSGMGSTLTAMVVTGQGAWLGHVGDSRAYLWRSGKLYQLTRDDSLVSHLVARGQLTPEEAKVFRYRNVLLQALGVQAQLSVQIVALRPRNDDVVLLCSDGLTACLDESAIASGLRGARDLAVACREFTERVCALGAPDNVTLALARFSGISETADLASLEARDWEFSQYEV
jgi:protein phosphatase